MRTRVLSAVVLAVAAAGLVVGCGGDSGSAGAAADGGGGTTVASSDSDQALVQFAQCMRDQGVDVPDPGDASGGAQGGPPAGDFDAAALRQAMQACGQYLQGSGGPGGAPDGSGFGGTRSELAQCLRDEGVDLPDPQTGQARGPGAAGLDSDDPAVQAALEKCGAQGGLPGHGDGR
jgi:hypothetical protein